jgi:hypothetical protein
MLLPVASALARWATGYMRENERGVRTGCDQTPQPSTSTEEVARVERPPHTSMMTHRPPRDLPVALAACPTPTGPRLGPAPPRQPSPPVSCYWLAIGDGIITAKRRTVTGRSGPFHGARATPPVRFVPLRAAFRDHPVPAVPAPPAHFAPS